MNTDVEFHIRQNYPWNKLPANVKQVQSVHKSLLGNIKVKDHLSIPPRPDLDGNIYLTVQLFGWGDFNNRISISRDFIHPKAKAYKRIA